MGFGWLVGGIPFWAVGSEVMSLRCRGYLSVPLSSRLGLGPPSWLKPLGESPLAKADWPSSLDIGSKASQSGLLFLALQLRPFSPCLSTQALRPNNPRPFSWIEKNDWKVEGLIFNEMQGILLYWGGTRVLRTIYCPRTFTVPSEQSGGI